MVALKSIKKREEIYNDYGQLPRSDLLRRYGYITDEYKKWDVVEINSDLIIRKACGQRNWNDSSKSKRVSNPYLGLLGSCPLTTKSVRACREMGSQ